FYSWNRGTLECAFEARSSSIAADDRGRAVPPPRLGLRYTRLARRDHSVPKRRAMPRIYCAGPLFNPAERREMDDIAGVLEAAGYTTFVPHRDGLEFARLLPELQHIVPSAPAADAVLRRAIFSLDVFQLLSRSDAVVANINGRVPDEGTVVEAALAWFACKAVVLYKNDSRSVLS